MAPRGRDKDTPRWAGKGFEYFEDQALSRARMRLLVLTVFVFLGFTSIGLRLADISIGAQANTNGGSISAVNHARHRAEIVDREGRLLARNVDIVSLGADPREVWDPELSAESLGPYLNTLSEDTLVRRLASDRHFVWLERRISPQQHYDIHNLGLPGMQFVEEQRRVYPHGQSLSHLVGFSNVDGEGIGGLELGLNVLLQSTDEPVILSVDLRVQHALRDELSAAMEEFGAMAAAGVVMNVNTGEVLALVSLPDFDPHAPGESSGDFWLNRVTGGSYELGSVVKPLTIAQALDEGLITPDMIFDVSEPLEVADATINDYHPILEPITAWDVLGESSNIGTVEIAGLIGPEGQQEFLADLGLFDRLPIEMPGAAHPLVPTNWGPVETATISFGHGLSMSPLHLASATAAMVNGGFYVEPTFLRREEGAEIPRRRVISAETSDTMRAMLRYVVTDGTGGNADVPGYEVAGKTGTGEKPRPGGGYYRSRLLSSFVAAFPSSDPEIVVFALLDEPHGTAATGNYATGGWTVAPAVGRIIQRIAPFAGVMPTDMQQRSEMANINSSDGADAVTLPPQ